MGKWGGGGGLRRVKEREEREMKRGERKGAGANHTPPCVTRAAGAHEQNEERAWGREREAGAQKGSALVERAERGAP